MKTGYADSALEKKCCDTVKSFNESPDAFSIDPRNYQEKLQLGCHINHIKFPGAAVINISSKSGYYRFIKQYCTNQIKASWFNIFH